MKKILVFMAFLTTFALNVFAAEADASKKAGTYKLKPADVLAVSVYKNDEIQDAEIKVDGQGFVTLPKAEKVSVKGLTLEEARLKMTELYEKHGLKNPQISLFISEYSN